MSSRPWKLMFASIKSLTLLLLSHNDRWPFFAAVIWATASIGATVCVVFKHPTPSAHSASYS